MSGIAPLVDALPAVRAMLLADAALVEQITGGAVPSASAAVVRLYGEGLPPNPVMLAGATQTSLPNVLPPTLVYLGSGGLHESFAWQPRIDLRAYAPTRAAARALWIAAYNALLARPGRYAGLYLEVLRGTVPVATDEPDGGYPVALGLITFAAVGG